MNLSVLTPPAVEPVGLDAARDFLRIDYTGEDDLVSALIAGARARLEAETGLALITRKVRLCLDDWPSPSLESLVHTLPVGPVSGLDRLAVWTADAGFTDQTVDVRLEPGRPARLVLEGAHWPWPERGVGGIEIDLTIGFGGVGDVPADLILALKSLIAHGYEHRTGEDWRAHRALPDLVEEMISPWRRVRL